MTLLTDGIIDDILPISDLPIIFWRNVVTAANLSSDAEDPDFPASNLANASLGLKWKQDFTGSPVSPPDYIIVDTTGLGAINYVAIVGHNFGTLGVTVAVEGSGDTGPSPIHSDSPPEAEYVTGYRATDNGPIIFMFEEHEPNTVRLRIENPSTTTPAELAVVFVGQCTVLPEGIQADHTPLPLAKRNDTVLGNSENGSFLGRIVLGAWAESSATIANFSKEWTRSELLDFLDYAAEFPFFYAWSPETYPDETAFAYLNNDPLPVFDIDGYGAVDLAMKGIIE